MEKLRKLWNFIWHDDSPLSWILNILIALVLVKFIIYPGLGLVLGTTHPLVAVVSGSMEHNGLDFDAWWETNGKWYEDYGITKEQFGQFSSRHGFNKGDIMILNKVDSPEIGDILVYKKSGEDSPPIIHRVVAIKGNSIQTKGDNVDRIQEFEKNIEKRSIIGKAIIRIPFLGYIKIWFIELIYSPIIGIFK